MKEKRELTVDEAISLLPDRNMVHVFVNSGMNALVGADHSLKSIIEKIKDAESLQLGGAMTISMGHGLVIFPKGAKYQSDLYFVETDKEALDKLDK